MIIVSLVQETFHWNGITNKKKGQKWGREKGSWRNGNDDNVCTAEANEINDEVSLVNDQIDFEKLKPLTSQPKVAFHTCSLHEIIIMIKFTIILFILINFIDYQIQASYTILCIYRKVMSLLIVWLSYHHHGLLNFLHFGFVAPLTNFISTDDKFFTFYLKVDDQLSRMS